MIIITGMSNQGLRCFLTLIPPSACVQLQAFLAHSDHCSVSTASLFIYLPLWPNDYHLQSLLGFISGISALLRMCKQKKWVFGSMQLNYNPAF